MRRYFLFVLILIILLLSNTTLAKSPIVDMQIEKQFAKLTDSSSNYPILYKLKYGNQNNQLGFHQSLQSCPQSFFVDKDETVTILDNINLRILEINKKNQIKNIKIKQIVNVGDIFKKTDNSYLILDYSTDEFTKVTFENGKTHQEKITFNDSLINGGINKNYEVQKGLFIPMEYSIRIDDRITNGLGEYYLQKNIDGKWVDWVFIFNVKIPIDFSDIKVLGVDKNRYSYIFISFIPKGVRSYETDKLKKVIFKIDESGNIVKIIQLNKGTKNHAHREVFLSYDGRLYHLWFGENEAIIYILESIK